MKTLKLIVLILAVAVGGFAQSNLATGLGRRDAYQFGQWQGQIWQGSTSTGAYTITLVSGQVALPGGQQFSPYNTNAPLLVGSGANAETVTPSSVSGCNQTAKFTCQITATFSNAHGKGDLVQSGTYGLQEALNVSAGTSSGAGINGSGGGLVSVGPGWAAAGGTTAMLAAAVPYPNTAIEDIRAGANYWNVAPTSATFLAVPTTLTAVTALPSATPAGSYGTGTYHLCVSYVDIMGNEGACSLDFSEAGLASGSFIFTAPAASTGAVGYTIYISLTGGTYALAYKVPLTSTVCALTKVETVTAACAVANTTYGQSAATATVTAITVNTARLAPQLGGASTTSDYSPNSNGHTVYGYVQSNRLGMAGVIGASLPFTGVTAPATTVPAVVGTLTLPAGLMNQVGRTLRVCGLITEASAGSTATISTIQLRWDSDGSNAAGVSVSLGGPTITGTLVTANADQWTFCQNLKTTVSGASATAGSIQAGAGFLTASYGAATTVSAASGPTIGAAAVGSLNLAGEARLQVVYLHTTGTDGAAPILTDLTAEIVN